MGQGHTSWHMRAGWLGTEIEDGTDDEEDSSWSDDDDDDEGLETSLGEPLLSHGPGRPSFTVHRDSATGSRYVNAHLHERALFEGQLPRHQVNVLRAQLRSDRKSRRTPVKATGPTAWRRRNGMSADIQL